MRLLRPALFALLCLIWGSTWAVIKVGYGGLGPFTVAGVRFLLAGLVLVPVGAWLAATGRMRWPRGREWRLVAWVGAVLFFLDYGLIYWGEQKLESGLTAVLFATSPLFTALLAHLYLPGERLRLPTLGGILLAIAGVGLLFADRMRPADAPLLPMLAILGAALAAAFSSVATKRHGAALHAVALNAPAMLLGALLLFGAALATGEDVGLPRDAGTWGAVLYLALAGSVVTFLIFFWLLKTWRATTLSLIALIIPLVALLLGLLLGERPTPTMGAGVALVLAGIGLTQLPARAR